MKESGYGIPNGERGRLAWRLARLTPSRAVTLSALRVRANTPGRFPRNHRNYHQFSFPRAKSTRVTARASPSAARSGILDARLIEIQMSISRRYEHAREWRGAARSGRARVLLSRPSRCRKRSPDRAHVCSRILFAGRGSQAPRLSCLRPVLSVLFYSHALPEQTRESRRISSCRARQRNCHADCCAHFLTIVIILLVALPFIPASGHLDADSPNEALPRIRESVPRSRYRPPL